MEKTMFSELELFFNFFDDILLIVSYNSGNNNYLQKANESACSILEYSEKELLNKSIYSIDKEMNAEKLNKIFSTIRVNRKHSYESIFTTKNGNEIPVDVTAFYFEKNNNNYILLKAHDITKQKEQEFEIEKLQKKADESHLLKTEFIKNVSHEIRTPMNGIIGFTALLRNPELETSTRNQYIDIIEKSSYQLMGIVDNILEVATLTTKQADVRKDELCLNAILQELYNQFYLRVQEKNINLNVNTPLKDKKVTIITDRNRLYKILVNLVENAVKFTSTGTITIGYTLRDPFLDIYVEDTGIGILPENREKIFDSFSQEDKNLSRKFGGLGVGLTIAYHNALLLDGKITFDTEKGTGSKFICSIPYKPALPQFDNKIKKPKILTDPNNNITILIAEDEGINYLYLKTILTKFEFPVKTLHANNGREAIDIFMRENKIDIILMDLKMPVLNGFDAAKEIRSINNSVPIIAQTAYSSTEDKLHAAQSGCNDYIIKPIQTHNLFTVLKKYIGKE